MTSTRKGAAMVRATRTRNIYTALQYHSLDSPFVTTTRGQDSTSDSEGGVPPGTVECNT
jgi:hypothetical protein